MPAIGSTTLPHPSSLISSPVVSTPRASSIQPSGLVDTLASRSSNAASTGFSRSVADRVVENLLDKKHALNSATSTECAFLKALSPNQIKKLVKKVANKSPNKVASRDVVKLFNAVKMDKLHHRNVSSEKLIEVLYAHESYRGQNNGNLRSPSWTQEKLYDPSLGELKVSGFYSQFEKWMCDKRDVSIGDLGINFSETMNNKIRILSDKEQFWPAIMADLEKSEDSVNINMFGLMGDEWGREVFDLLIKKSKEGVKVRVMADALGARMHWYFGHKNESFIKYLRENGIEVVITSEESSGGNFHFDHRKYFVIDGKLAYNTGYTIEEHMRHIHFDMGMRIEGDMVKQLQANYFTNFKYFGGSVNDSEGPFDYQAFMSRYFLETPNMGDTKARLLINIPHVQHRATEVYYQAISKAKEKISIMNEFLSDNELMDIIEKKAKEGVEVEIVFPGVCEWEGYKFIAYDFFDRLKNYPNVKAYLYDGPKDTGWLHTKGILIDNHYVNFGSTNMDELSLYHNYEQNIETEDLEIAAAVQKEIFDYALRYSKEYNEESLWSRSIKTWFYKMFKRVIEP